MLVYEKIIVDQKYMDIIFGLHSYKKYRTFD
jgi:hypothetical protein